MEKASSVTYGECVLLFCVKRHGATDSAEESRNCM